MAKTPQSRKAKGRKLQTEVRDAILERYPELEPDDVASRSMGASGTDLALSPLARKKFPYSVECKNVEKIAIWSAIEQAESNCKEGTAPLVVFRRNRSKTYVALTLEEFLNLQTRGSHASTTVITTSSTNEPQSTNSEPPVVSQSD
jgi:hypothetical protein